MASWLFLFGLPACVSTTVPMVGLALDEDTVKLEGWFSARGEWAIFSELSFSNYDPYAQNDKRCVSLINVTGLRRSEYKKLQGKRVIAVGYAVRYDDLLEGTNPVDRLLSKKFFKDDVVENYCLRDFVFAARSISAAR
jgi:hypothetical protein